MCSLLLEDHVCGDAAMWYTTLDPIASWKINKRELFKRFDNAEMRVQIYCAIFNYTQRSTVCVNLSHGNVRSSAS